MPRENLRPDGAGATEVIRDLGLEPLPDEGGWFRRIAEGGPLSAGDGQRRTFSVIHALFTPGEFSAWHRLAVEETWEFLAGDPFELTCLPGPGSRPGGIVQLGGDRSAGQCPSHVVPAGVWQGGQVVPGGRWTLVSCRCRPGFCPEDFELGSRAELLAEYPEWSAAVVALTRGPAVQL